MNMKKDIIGLKEIVIIVLLSALTIVVNILTAIPFMASAKWSVWGGYSLSAFISGPIYLLMIAKSPKKGTNLLFFAVIALYAMIMGQIPTGLVYLMGGILCELIMLHGGYNKLVRIGISFSVHNVIYGIGSFTPMFIGADAYAKQMLDAGMDQTMVDSMIYDLIAPKFVAISSVILIVVSILGILVGTKMMKKHFQPAGIA